LLDNGFAVNVIIITKFKNWEYYFTMTYARLLNEKAECLTPSQKNPEYILANDEEAIFLTIRISRQVKVSVATWSRGRRSDIRFPRISAGFRLCRTS
jgi:hypothetical protein